LDLTSFAQLVMLPLDKSELASPLHHRRTKPPLVLAPWYSIRLPKKSCNRTSAIVVAQNVLIHKLGLATGLEMDTTAFEKYIMLFWEGLSEEQARRVVELKAA
jgi:hypothetical protein